MKNKIIVLLMIMPAMCLSQPKLFSKKDIAPMTLSFTSGHLNGWREEVLYHPNQLFEQFPGLNRRFWDIRVQDDPGFLNTEWDADHVLEMGSKAMMVAAVTFKLGQKQKWYWYLWDAVKYMSAYKLGEFSSYNLIHKNKL